MNWTYFFKVFVLLVLASECFGAVPANNVVDSPIVKEIEQKKAIYSRKPPQGKNIVVVPKKPIKGRKIASAGANRTLNNGGAGGGGHRAIPVNKRGPGPLRHNPASNIQQEILRKQHQNSQSVNGGEKDSGTDTQTAASDRTFFPPYKYPFWGMPYGIYSNGGFINPGLFPFVPGGPGFPPYDGIFGSPFGPGLFPGKQNPIPPGVGTPMIPQPPGAAPALAAGQPPLNPTGNRRGPPPGAYSPGSPVGYKKPKSKPKGKPKPKPAPADESECPCNRHKDKDEEEYNYSPPPSRPHKRPKHTPAPCPCSGSSKPKPSSYKKGADHDDDDDYHYDERPSPTPVCPFAHEHDPPTTTTPAYSPPPAPSYATTSPPVPDPPYPKKPRICRLKHKTRTIRYADGTSGPSDYVPKQSSPPPPLPPPPPPPETKKPCPLKTQKSVEYIYITQPTTTTTTTTTTPSPPPTYPSQSPPATYQHSQPNTYQQQQSPPSYKQQQSPQMQAPAYSQQNQQPDTQSVTSQQTATYQQISLQSNYSDQQSQKSAEVAYQQSQPAAYQQAQVTPPAVVYSASPQTSPQLQVVDQSASGSHSTILYKPVPAEIIQTPTSVTVPLPLPPFMIDSKGNLVQQNPSPNPQQVTYKVDLNPDLLTKITTPVMMAQNRHATVVPVAISSQNPSLRQILTAGNGKHYIIDNQPITLASSSSSRAAPQMAQQQQQIYPQSRVLIVDNVPISQPSPITYSSQSVIQPSSMPSVVVLNSDSVYDLLQGKTQQQSQPSALSYIQPQQYSSSATSSSPIYLSPSVQSVPDYNFVAPEQLQQNIRGHHHRTPIPSNMPYPYRYSSPSYQDYEEEVRLPPRRPSHASNYNTKDYVVIDRDELEELKRTLTTSDELYEDDDKNLPPPPELVHIDYHHATRLEDPRDDANKPLAFSGNRNSPSWENHRLDHSHYMRNYDGGPGYIGDYTPHRSMASLFDPSKGPDGSKQFSKIFEMNNADIRGVGTSGNRKKKNKNTLVVFDKYLENSEGAEDDK